MDAKAFLHELRGMECYRGQIVYERRVAGRRGVCGPRPGALGSVGAEVARALGIARLWPHQFAALDTLRAGADLVLNSGPASGKSLVFQVSTVEHALAEPAAGTLIICPNRAVAEAQRRKLLTIAERVCAVGDAVTRYDGDLNGPRRRAERQRPIVVTNPDMLHRGILPNHPRWADWFGRLELVVLEELHAYSGLFGSNVAGLMRRLWRVCRHYGSSPRCVCTTSTIANPAEHAQRLLGRTVRVVGDDDSPRGMQTHVFWNPRTEPPTAEAGRIMAELLARGHSAIAFSRARVACELIAEYARHRLAEGGLAPSCVLAYRGGLRPEERAELQERLHAGQTVGVSSTNALELGLDLPAIDAAIVCGWPGALSSYWQQAARAGRAGQHSAVFFVGLHDPVNAFLMAHPDYVFDRPVEQAVIERENPHVVACALRCAAQELPVRGGEFPEFGAAAAETARVLVDRGKLYERDGVWYNAASERPAQEMPLRGHLRRNVIVQDADSGQLIAKADWIGAHNVVHPQAIYLHQGRQYRVMQFDRERRHAYVEEVQVDHYTNPLGRWFVHSVDRCLRQRELAGGAAFFGEVTAGCIVTGYEERRYATNELIRTVPLQLPPALYETMGIWLCLSEEREAELSALGLNAEFRGLSNALRIVLPLFMTCDVLDLRPWAGQTNFPWLALYFYERYARGLGYTERLFDSIAAVLAAAVENLRDCDCDDGCPCCVGDIPWPFIANNPELETDLIPSRRAVHLLIEALRSADPIEDLIVSLYDSEAAADLLQGRGDLLKRRRAEAADAPMRRLPSDRSAGSKRAELRLPLALERSVRRRIDKMRTAEQPQLVRPVQQATTPAPGRADELPQADPAMRRRDQARIDREALRRLAGRPAGDDAAGPHSRAEAGTLPDAADLGAEAVRRLREARRPDRG